jgi:lipopolysaccharide transport system permease protein
MKKNNFFELVFYKSYFSLISESKRTILSMGWWVLEPILTMLVYYVVFAYFLNIKAENYVFYLLISLVFFQWFAKSVTSSMNTINDSGSIISKIATNKLFFPLTAFTVDLIKTTVVVIILIIGLNIFSFTVNFSYVYLPLILIAQFIFTLSVAFWVALIIPFFPDIRILVDLLIRGLMFASAIFYPIQSLPQQVQEYMVYNPIAILLEGYRQILLYGSFSFESSYYYLVLIFISVILLVAAILFERKASNSYIKIILK